MADVENILLAVCGLGVICGGGVLLLAFTLLRVGRGGLMAAIASGLTAFMGDSDQEEVADNTPIHTHRSYRDSLHSRIEAANQEFDRVLHKDKDLPEHDAFTAASRPRESLPRNRSYRRDRPVDYTGEEHPRSGLRDPRRRPRRDTRHHEQNEDEIFGGMFDD